MRRLLSILFLTGFATASMAADVPFNSDWKEQRFSLFSSNDYSFRGKTLSVVSDGSVSLAYAPVNQALWGATTSTWSWSVKDGVPATDLRKKGGDDRNLALYAIFLPPEQAQRLKGQSVRKLLKSDDVRVLIYVWGGAHARGAVLASPYLGARGKTIVLRPSGTGNFEEKVNLAKDYQRAFGAAKPAIVGLAVSADSDDTDSKISASISGLSLN